MKIVYEKQAIKALQSLLPKTATLIVEKVKAFASGQKTGLDITALKGTDNGYRLQQGDWRILMAMEDDTIIVKKIKTRGDVYK